MTRSIRRFLIALVWAALLIPTGSLAMTSDTSTVADREARIQKQLTELLQKDETRQEHALQIISHYAHVDQYDASFFRPFVSPLLEIVAKSDADELRIMAISTLSSIGTPPAIEGLEAQVNAIASSRVQTMAQRAVIQYKLDQADGKKERFTSRIQ